MVILVRKDLWVQLVLEVHLVFEVILEILGHKVQQATLDQWDH